MTNQKQYFIEQVGEMQLKNLSDKLSRYGIALKQTLFYMNNTEIKENYYKDLNRYFMMKSTSNENAKQILENALKQHKENLEVLQI